MMYLAVIVHIHGIITSKGKEKRQKLSRYGNQCLHLEHAPVQHLLVLLMHDPIGFNHIDGRKKQQLPHQRTTPFRDPALPLMLDKVYSCADVVEIDYQIPGCAPSGDVIYSALSRLLAGKFHGFDRETIRFD